MIHDSDYYDEIKAEDRAMEEWERARESSWDIYEQEQEDSYY